MRKHGRSLSAWVLLVALLTALAAACGSTSDDSSTTDGSTGTDATIGFGDGGLGDGSLIGALTITPANQTLNVRWNTPTTLHSPRSSKTRR